MKSGQNSFFIPLPPRASSFFRSNSAGARIFFTTALLFCVAGNALAQSTNAIAAPVPLPLPLPNAGVSVLRVLSSLAIVIGIFLGGAWLFKNWRRISMPGARQPKLNIIESRSLGARQAIVVIGYEKQRFLVTTAPTGVNLLTHLPDASEDEVTSSAKASTPLPFAQALAEVLKKK
jgi:flagellar biogenesis protein FliO